MLFDIERDINGLSAAERLRLRQQKSAPLLAELESWLREQRSKLSRSSQVIKPVDYMLKRWSDFARTDGRICLTNNAAERSLRGLAMTESLCPSSSSVWKQLYLIFRIELTRTTGGHIPRATRPHRKTVTKLWQRPSRAAARGPILYQYL